MSTHWNYRVIRHVDHKMQPTDPDSYYYSIHEVYYENDLPIAWSQEGVSPLAETPEDLRTELERMLFSLTKPVFCIHKARPPKESEEDRLVEIK